MICTGNCFDNEKRAAMAANLLCDFLCIERKNPMINIDLNEKTPQKTKSKMYQSKTKIIVNEKGKVEDRNILTVSCQKPNAKRKRKNKIQL